MSHLTPLDLGRGPGAASLFEVHQASPALAALAGRFARAFIVVSRWAPGFCCVGAEVALNADEQQAYAAPRLSLTGSGKTLGAALVSCLGEAADRLSDGARPGDIRPAGPPTNAVRGGWIAQATPQGDIDWIDARDITTGAAVALPADLCIRRPPERRAIEPVGALSAGVAAGPDFASAALRAGLELCERDAAALWWLGGKRPKAFPLEHPAAVAGVTLITALRQDRMERRTVLLDITTDLEIPAVAAVSLDRNGRGLACGLAARLDWADAARAAILEMCQMELAAPLAEAKRAERGDSALNDIDRRHLQRASFAASTCALIRSSDLSTLPPPRSPAPDQLKDFAERLGRKDIRLFSVDLTRPDIGVAVARMVSPDLQPYTGDVVTERLRRCRVEHNDAHLAVGAISLM